MQQQIPLNILPKMITKKQLRAYLGAPGPPIDHKTLKRRLILDGILSAAGLQWQDIRTAQYLPPHLTKVIYETYFIESL